MHMLNIFVSNWKEGFLSLYKGMGPPLMSLSILNTLNFSSYSYFRDIYGANKGWDVRNGLAGTTAGLLASSISRVENLVKVSINQVECDCIIFLHKYILQ